MEDKELPANKAEPRRETRSLKGAEDQEEKAAPASDILEPPARLVLLFCGFVVLLPSCVAAGLFVPT